MKKEKKNTLDNLLHRYKIGKKAKLFSKVITELKSRAYYKRVHSYLTEKRSEILRHTYFNKFKNAYVAHHTESYKLRKASGHHSIRLLSVTL